MDYPDQLRKDRANQLKDDNYKSSPENAEDAPMRELPRCEECDTNMHAFYHDGISGWCCNECGWSIDDEYE